MGCQIAHIEIHLAPAELSCDDLAVQFPELTAELIFRKTGIRTRHCTTPDVIASDLAVTAAQELFKRAEIEPEAIDMLFFVTECPDYIAPVSASVIHNKLNLNAHIAAFDLPGGCAGFTNALGIIRGMFLAKACSNVLLLVADTPRLVSNPDDFHTQSLFSDGAAAIWITESQEDRIGMTIFGTDGSGMNALYADRSGFRNPVDQKWLKAYSEVGGMPNGEMKMDGVHLLSLTLRHVPGLVEEILKQHELMFEDIDLFVFNQSSLFILKSLQRKLSVPEEKMAYYIEDYGNTVGVSIPIALKESEKEGKIQKGSVVLVAGFGIGFTWSGTILYY